LGVAQSYTFSMGSYHTTVQMCQTWMLQPFDGKISADRFIKERLSLVEIGFRQREDFVAELNAKLPQNIAAAETFDLRGPRKGSDSKGDRVRLLRAVIQASPDRRRQVRVLHERKIVVMETIGTDAAIEPHLPPRQLPEFADKTQANDLGPMAG
jgi:hypothetical protein